MKKDESQNSVFHILGANYELPQTSGTNKTKNTILMTATILFAQRGYEAVSMRDIANAVDIQAPSLYNHFPSKEKLLDAVLDHAEELYLLYFWHLDKELKKAESFEEILGIFFAEPQRMDNVFTNYAFCFVQSEQFNSKRAANIYLNTFLKYSIDFIGSHFDRCIEKKWVAPFDSRIVAAFFIHSVLQAINVQVQILMGHEAPYDPKKMIEDLHNYILATTASGR